MVAVCDACGEEQPHDAPLPLKCWHCSGIYFHAKKPWAAELSTNDRRMLKSFRISIDRWAKTKETR